MLLDINNSTGLTVYTFFMICGNWIVNDSDVPDMRFELSITINYLPFSDALTFYNKAIYILVFNMKLQTSIQIR